MRGMTLWGVGVKYFRMVKNTMVSINYKRQMIMKKEEKKEKRYKKSALRKTLEKNMRLRRNEPVLTVSPMEFSRWLRYYCEIKGLDEKLLKAKTLPDSVVDGFGKWLGDPLR